VIGTMSSGTRNGSFGWSATFEARELITIANV
jgi:hypothetical protein